MLTLDLKYLFDLYGEKLVNDLIARMNEDNSNASGAGAKSLRYKSSSVGLQITGNSYLGALSDGLHPNQYENKSPQGAPSPRKLEEWVRRKVAVGADEKAIRNLSFAISKTIQANGTLERFGYLGRGTDFIQFVIDKNNRFLLEDIANETLEQIGMALETEFSTYKDIEIK